MPRPPPPAAAFTSRGKPISSGGPPGSDRHACLERDPLARELVAAEPQRLGRRADPEEPRGVDSLREVAALGEEAVAGMNRVGAERSAAWMCSSEQR